MFPWAIQLYTVFLVTPKACARASTVIPFLLRSAFMFGYGTSITSFDTRFEYRVIIIYSFREISLAELLKMCIIYL